MQVRYRYKLRPSFTQQSLMSEWLVTLRKHRNYSLREREDGWNTNNRDADERVGYAWGACCDVETRIEWGSCCPLTCPVVKHGVMSAALTKTSKKKGLQWGSAADVQGKRTTELRHESNWFGRINSDVLQRNIARLNSAYSGFWQHGHGFPSYQRAATFKSFEYKPSQVKFASDTVYLPGIGQMRYFNSRPFPVTSQLRTATVIKEAHGWYVSVLVKTPEELPVVTDVENLSSNVSFDVGINKLASLSDGSHIENPKFSTNKRMRRRIRIRQRRVNRKVKGSNNRAKAGVAVAKLHKQVRDKRDAYQWKAANKIAKTAESVTHEALQIKNMKKRCKPKRSKGRFMPNGQAAKRGLNRSISDAAWGALFQKVAWLAAKMGKPVFTFEPAYSSQECSKCQHRSADNRKGEKFICVNCGHIDHADTQAARTGQKRIRLSFVSKDIKNLLVDCEKVTPVRYAPASNGKRAQGRNPISKQLSLFKPG